MQSDVLKGLIERIKLLAVEIFSKRSIINRNIILRNNEASTVLFPACRIRKKPLIVVVKDDRIIFKNALLGINPELSGRIKQLADIHKVNVDGTRLIWDEGSLHVELPIEKRMPIGLIEERIRNILLFIKEGQRIIQEYSSEISIENYGSVIIDFLGNKYALVPLPASIALEDIKQAWLPYTVITLPDEQGMFFCSSIGIDFLNLPLLSIISEDLEKCYIYLPDKSFPPSLKPHNVVKYIEKLKSFMENEVSPINLFDEKFVEKLLERALNRYYALASKSFGNETISLRPKPDDPQTSQYEEDVMNADDASKLREMINTIKELRDLLTIAKKFSKELEDMVISRLLLTLIIKIKQGYPEIIIGRRIEEESRRVTKSKRVYISVKDLIRNNSREVIISKVKTINGEVIYIIREKK